MVHRRREVSRIEGFSDAVFAFALTLLVVSLEVPKTFAELIHLIRGLPVFGICFAMLYQVWWRQYRFFRSYDLEDSFVIVTTGILLFVVLFFVYPLKFAWSLAFAGIEGRRALDLTVRQGAMLFVIYGVGFMVVFSLLALLYWHAYRLRDQLGLTPRELVTTRVQIYRNVSFAGFGLLSCAIALIALAVAPGLLNLAGPVYFAIGISETVLGNYESNMLKKLAEAPQGHRSPQSEATI